VRGFYGGASLANFAFYSQPDIKSWEQLKGETMAISSPGGLTDVLARYALRKYGLEPEKDVNLVVAGAGAANLAALQAGRVDAVELTAPFTWQAEDAGFTTLGTQISEVASEWPRSIYYSKDAFIQQNPNTLRAFLRAHVRAIRLAKANPDLAIQTLQDKLKLDRDLAKKSYDELVGGLNERGAMPSQAMPVFWQISVATGDVTEPWAEERYLDRRFIDTFDQWAPPAVR
jgi:NitT/TauT family transport system substrate-binding protein